MVASAVSDKKPPERGHLMSKYTAEIYVEVAHQAKFLLDYLYRAYIMISREER